MRIGVDARLMHHHKAGISKYTWHLLQAFANLNLDDEFIIFQHREQREPILTRGNMRRATLYAPVHSRLEQYMLPLELLRFPLDLLHTTDFIQPLYARVPTVITVHDLAFLFYPAAPLPPTLIIHTDAEDTVVEVMKRTWAQHEKLVATLSAILRKYGLTNEALKMNLTRSIGVQRQEQVGHWYTAVNNDTVVEAERLADNSVDLIHTSIPFGNHYEYSPSKNDFGHNPTDEIFWQQMDFLTPHLLRVLKPGRIAAIHVKDRLLYGHQNGLGVMSIDPFSDDCVRNFRKHGFIYMGRITITTDVVRENNSTYRLTWSEMVKDGSKMGIGMPEYLSLIHISEPTRPY